ncbi:hypothetical protein E2P81_ATG03845 [Venturia nashicola]|nr:hypothetical protein E2P81_ATG03845 [Venturia nashicola]
MSNSVGSSLTHAAHTRERNMNGDHNGAGLYSQKAQDDIISNSHVECCKIRTLQTKKWLELGDGYRGNTLLSYGGLDDDLMQ